MQEEAIAHEESKYKRMNVHARRQFLADHVRGHSTDLRDRFASSVLSWEPDATCRWFLVKAVGLKKIIDGVPILLHIVSNPMLILTIRVYMLFALGVLVRSATSWRMKF